MPEIRVRFLDIQGRPCGEIGQEVAPALLAALRDRIDPAVYLEQSADRVVLPFYERQRVPDVVRYEYNADTGQLTDVEDLGRFGSKEVPIGRLVTEVDQQGVLFILESPHEDEVNHLLEPRYPAVGDTGARIHQHRERWARLLRQLPVSARSCRVSIILCEPLPHPASLRLRLKGKVKRVRNDLFRKAMGIKAVEAWFLQRLEMYAPALVINACTGSIETPNRPEPACRNGPDPHKDPKAVVRAMLDGWAVDRAVGRSSYTSCKVDGTRRLMKLPVPELRLVEFPHPASWHTVGPENWFFGGD